MQGRPKAWPLCWMVKVLDEKHEPRCYSVPRPAKLALLERAETSEGEGGAPPRGTELQGWAPLKARGERLPVEQRASVPSCLCPLHPQVQAFVATQEVPGARQVSPLGQRRSMGWSESQRREAQPCGGAAPATGTAREEASLGKIVAASANRLPERRPTNWSRQQQSH